MAQCPHAAGSTGGSSIILDDLVDEVLAGLEAELEKLAE
jgi:hypothetical protein